MKRKIILLPLFESGNNYEMEKLKIELILIEN